MKTIATRYLAALLTCWAVTAVCPRPVGAVIYRWVDTNRVLSFSNTPPVGKRLGKVERLAELGGPPATESAAAPATAAVVATAEAIDESGAVAGTGGKNLKQSPLRQQQRMVKEKSWERLGLPCLPSGCPSISHKP